MFDQYIVVITGATSGLGLASAKKFLAEGAIVIGIGRSFEKTKDLGKNFIPMECDVTDSDQVKAVCDEIEAKYGRVDTLFNNAGTGSYGNILNVTVDTMDMAYKLLLRSSFLFVKYLAPIMKDSRNPSIAFTASVGGFLFMEDFTYAVFKSAVINYSRQCAHQLNGIRCNAVCPGYIRTGILPNEVWENVVPQDVAAKQQPIARIGEPEEVANLVAFLASDKATYINGAVITIDGGYTLCGNRVDMLK